MFKDKTLLITGGTGSFGNAVLDKYLKSDLKEIRIFSRDELKQDEMRHKYQQIAPEYSNKIKFYIGDVRNPQSIRDAMYGVDFVFHAAALKQVPSCEFFPMEAVRTNVVGTENVLNAAVKEGVEKVICLSTDKAAYPVNAMGTSKAMMEKVAVAKARTVSPERTEICVTRYGNVLASRGSVVPLFINQMRDGKELTVTDPNMTRFIMTLEEAVDLVVYAFEHAESGDIMVQKAPASTIGDLMEATKQIFNPKAESKQIGIRHGEKMYETLLTNEECAHAIDMGDFYRVPADTRDLNYDKYFSDGDEDRNLLEEFNSDNTKLMTVEQVREKLLSVPLVQEELEAWKAGQ
ncbi:polysaccharide biosynthesis protein [Alkalibacterium sp. m-11]|uniref:UDP-glucose 4-epimerase n=1 Tax=Alkalibacterium indicireducens TaxID=398758 RepID=A0ABN1AKA9_9LACT